MVIARVPLAALEGQPIKAQIAQAAQATGESFDFLVKTAVKESSLQADAKAPGSSAAGLFQFIESTWLRLVRDYGDKYGIGTLAKEVKGEGDARPKVDDAQTKEKILNLRFDPKLSAQMAAELTSENRNILQGALGRPVGDTELYLAHFLGAGGASRFLTDRKSKPDQSAASLFPEAAAANKSIFFDSGRPRSLDEVYDRLAKGFSDTPTQLADSGAQGPSTPPASAANMIGGSVSVDEFVAQLFRTVGVPATGSTMSPAFVAALSAMEPMRAIGSANGFDRYEDQRRANRALFT